MKTRQKLESEKTRVYAQKLRLKMPFKNSISGQLDEKGFKKKKREQWEELQALTH